MCLCMPVWVYMRMGVCSSRWIDKSPAGKNRNCKINYKILIFRHFLPALPCLLCCFFFFNRRWPHAMRAFPFCLSCYFLLLINVSSQVMWGKLACGCVSVCLFLTAAAVAVRHDYLPNCIRLLQFLWTKLGMGWVRATTTPLQYTPQNGKVSIFVLASTQRKRSAQEPIR